MLFRSAIKNRLLTKDRMASFGMNADPVCVLCCTTLETATHLFSSCTFIRGVLISSPFDFCEDWNNYLNGRIVNNDARGWKFQVAALYLTITFYHIWSERNFRLHNQVDHSCITQIALRVKRMFREKLFSNASFQRKVAKDPSIALILY